MYVCPRFIGLAPSGNFLQIKMVGNLMHGHALVLHLVYPQVADNSNLVCHCMDSSIHIMKSVRRSKGQPDYLPANWRSQLDGVSTNWGSTTFAHHENLHRRGVIGETADLCRNPVGSTHEDIDALFGVAKNHLINKDCVTPQELKHELRAAFETYALPVFIVDVDAVLDYKAFYQPHIDPALSGYGWEVIERDAYLRTLETQ